LKGQTDPSEMLVDLLNLKNDVLRAVELFEVQKDS
jgi:hypothetical protein